MVAEDSAMFSPQSVPKEQGDVKEHAGSVSEVLAPFQDRFPVDDRAFQFPISGEVKNTVLAGFLLPRTERGKAVLPPGPQTEACEFFNSGRWSRPLTQEYQAQETASRARLPAKECQVQRKR